MMGEVSMETAAYAKIILHAAKYPHAAVNGILLADGNKLRNGAKNQDLDILDAIPMFHHSHYLSPMAEIALMQIETKAEEDNRVIAGYYAACEHYAHSTPDKCPGQKIAEKIAEHVPAAVFVVVENKKLVQHLNEPAINLYKYSGGRWVERDSNKVLFQTPYVLETVSHLLQRMVQKDLCDFDNFLDDPSQDWTNLGIEKLIASINASNAIDLNNS